VLRQKTFVEVIMGHQSFLLVLLASILLSMAIFTFMQVWSRSTQGVTNELEMQQALNVATSGVNQAISKLRHEKTWRYGFHDKQIAGGSCTLTLTDLGIDSIRIVSVGNVGHASHTSTVVVRLASIFPSVESSLTVYGDSVNFINSGKSFLIDGRDHNPDGTLGTHPPVSGLGVIHPATESYLESDLAARGIGANIMGAGGAPSVGTFPANNLIDLRNMYRDIATMTLPTGSYSGNAIFGTAAQPEILYVPGNLDWHGNITGAGILVVDGKLAMYGKIVWLGIVIAVSGDLTLDIGGTGTPTIIGTCLVGNSVSSTTTVRVNGNTTLQYSYDTLVTILSNLDLLAVEVLSWWE
jgi:hypothetical protein